MDDDERPRRNMHAPRGGAHQKKFSGAPKSNRGPESGSQNAAFKKSKKPFFSKFKSSAGRKRSGDR